MTQGKLYEKILEGKRGQYTDSIWSADDEIYFEVIEVADGHVQSVLDEAKKEFPLESDFLLAIAEKGFERATFQFLLDLHLKRNVWFEKWFGSEHP
jgi:hypothetical protein